MKHIISIILFYVLFYNMKVSHIYVVAQIKEYKAKVWAEVHPWAFLQKWAQAYCSFCRQRVLSWQSEELQEPLT